MLKKRNPKSSRSDLTEVGELVAEFSDAATKLSPAARKRLFTHKARFRKLILKIVAESEAITKPFKLVAKSASQTSQGTGLGKMLSANESKARIAAYATPTKIEGRAYGTGGRFGIRGRDAHC